MYREAVQLKNSYAQRCIETFQAPRVYSLEAFWSALLTIPLRRFSHHVNFLQYHGQRGEKNLDLWRSSWR